MTSRPLSASAAPGTIALLGLVTAVACRGPLASATASGGRPGEALVQSRPVEDVFVLTGEMAAVRSIELTVPRSDAGQQIKWLAEDGAEVRKGDHVVEFDNTQVVQRIEDLRLKARQAGIERESKERSLAAEEEKRRVAVEKAQIEHELAGVEAAVPAEVRSRAEWLEKQAAMRQAEAALAKAGAERDAFAVSSRAEREVLLFAEEKARRELESSERMLEGLTVRAPRDGILIVGQHWNWNEDRKLQQGDTVWPGLTVASIPELGEMQVWGRLPEVDHGRIARGQAARCILDTYPGRVFAAKVEDVASVAEAGGGRVATAGGYRVRLSLEKTEAAVMRPGMSVRVEVVRRSWPRALVVPRQAVRRKQGKTVVSKEGRETEVRIAACTPLDCVVESGLAEGDRVAVR
jgi:RND family efflux transporter MFP subunit